jgi:hypothetical protein
MGVVREVASDLHSMYADALGSKTSDVIQAGGSLSVVSLNYATNEATFPRN